MKKHPNRLPFHGVLTVLDAPSDRPPAGARGHRVVLTRAAAEAALPSLIGMAVDFTTGFDGHDARRKVGVITSAEITAVSRYPERSGGALPRPDRVGAKDIPNRSEAMVRKPSPGRDAGVGVPRAQNTRTRDLKLDGPAPRTDATVIAVAGYIFARDFPEVVREIASARDLGMSYEVADAAVEDIRAPVWKLTAVTFTGAAILRRKKAAYEQTSISLAASSKPRSLDYAPAGASLGMTNQGLGAPLGMTKEALKGRGFSRAVPGQFEIGALAPEGNPHSRGRLCHQDQGDSMNNELTKQFLETSERLAAAAQALESTLARLDAQHNELTTKIDRMVAAVDDSAERKTLEERVSDLLSKKEELEKQNADLKAQAARGALRKTLPPIVSALLAKNGIDASDKFEVSALDKILAPLSVEQRIAVKGEMARAGVIS